MSDDQMLQEQERDMNRARVDLEHFFAKCETGMQTVDDVKEAKRVMNIFGINIEVD